jgi:hypothetical protein
MLGMIISVGMGKHMAERFWPLYLQDLAQASTAILAIGLLAPGYSSMPSMPASVYLSPLTVPG